MIRSMIKTTKKRIVYRHALDLAAETLIRLGGISVIVFVVLVFVYLLRQVMPLFGTPELSLQDKHSIRQDNQLQNGEEIFHLALERQNQIVAQLVESPGAVRLVFYDIGRKLELPEHFISADKIQTFAADSPQRRTLAISVSVNNGEVILLRHNYAEDFSTATRLMVPQVSYPFGDEPIALSSSRLTQIALLSDQRQLTLIGYDAAGELHGKSLLRSENLITGEISREENDLKLPRLARQPDFMLLFESQLFLLAAGRDGDATVIRLDGNQPAQNIRLTAAGCPTDRRLAHARRLFHTHGGCNGESHAMVYAQIYAHRRGATQRTRQNQAL